MGAIQRVQQQLTPDQRILALTIAHLEPWLRRTSMERLQEMIASGEDLTAALPSPLPLDKLNWAERGVLRARVCVPRPDLYRAILDRLDKAGHTEKVNLIRRLDGAARWYTGCMERVRARVLAALGGSK